MGLEGEMHLLTCPEHGGDLFQLNLHLAEPAVLGVSIAQAECQVGVQREQTPWLVCNVQQDFSPAQRKRLDWCQRCFSLDPLSLGLRQAFQYYLCDCVLLYFFQGFLDLFDAGSSL